MAQRVRRTGLPEKVIANYRFRRSAKTVWFECWWCGKQGTTTRERFEREHERYVDLLIAHVDAHEAVVAAAEIFGCG